MSYWHEKKFGDLSYSLDGKDLHIYLENDDNGTIYASVPLEDLKRFLKKKPPVMKYPKETRWTPKKK